jgi:hypothetical protein
LQLAYNGISYLDEVDEAILKQQLEENVFFLNAERNMSFRQDYNTHKDNINRVIEWLNKATDDSSFNIDTDTPFLQYLMHTELRNRYPNVWTLSGDNSVLSIIFFKEKHFPSAFLSMFTVL